MRSFALALSAVLTVLAPVVRAAEPGALPIAAPVPAFEAGEAPMALPASPKAGPSGGDRVTKTERATMLASLKNFRSLVEHSSDQLHPIPNSDQTHDSQWYLDQIASLEKDVTADEDPNAARMDGYEDRYDKLKQGLVDQVYDGCPRCFNRDRRVAVNALQLKMDEAEVLRKKFADPALKDEDKQRLNDLSGRLDSIRGSDLRALRWDLGMKRRPLTAVPTDDGGSRSFYDRLRKKPEMPAAPLKSGFVPPPPVDGKWRPNKWVSRGNWADYQRLVPWLQRVMDFTGTTALMQEYGIERPMDFALALISTESSFYHGAASGSGAHGFMQLLVGTARQMMRENHREYKELMAQEDAKALGVSQVNGRTLESDWKTNVFLGVAYLRQHVQEFGARLAKAGVSVEQSGPVLQGLIAAAYNSGEGRVRQYWKRLHVALEDHSQSIVPFRETRKYVRKVDAMSEMNWVNDPT